MSDAFNTLVFYFFFSSHDETKNKSRSLKVKRCYYFSFVQESRRHQTNHKPIVCCYCIFHNNFSFGRYMHYIIFRYATINAFFFLILLCILLKIKKKKMKQKQKKNFSSNMSLKCAHTKHQNAIAVYANTEFQHLPFQLLFTFHFFFCSPFIFAIRSFHYILLVLLYKNNFIFLHFLFIFLRLIIIRYMRYSETQKMHVVD